MKLDELTSIVVVEDDAVIRAVLEMALTAEGFTHVVSCARGDEGLETIRRRKPDLVLLDVMLPGVDGFAICTRIRALPALSGTRVIMLTARTQNDDIVRGLQCGADDYVTKPFDRKVLMARIRAVLARSVSTSAAKNELRHEGLVLNTTHQTVTADGSPLALTKTEFDLLSLLMRERGHVLSRSQLIRRAWPEGVVVTDRAVDVNITRLRKKLGDYARCIVSRPGFGYMFDA